MAETSWTDRRVIEASRNFVCIVGHEERQHESVEVLCGREKVKLCSKYYTIPCETHMEGAKLVRRFFQGRFRTPATVFITPSGQELSRKEGGLGPGELLRQMNEALSKVPGEKIPQPVWRAGQELLRDARSALEKKDPRKAIEAWTKLGKLGRSPWFREKSKEGLDQVNAEGEKLLQEALALESPAEKKKALQKIAEDFKPLAVSIQARKELEGVK